MEKDVTNSSFTGIELPDFDAVMDEVRKQMLERIKMRTPVKTGAARDGWHIEGENIVNHVPYVDVLEYGTSDQAPNGMVRVSMEELPQVIDAALKKQNK